MVWSKAQQLKLKIKETINQELLAFLLVVQIMILKKEVDHKLKN
jgi:hypothetical protein